jgi:hypothetical protein
MWNAGVTRGEVPIRGRDIAGALILHRRGWLKEWVSKTSYQVGVGVVQLQKWLNEGSNLGEVNRMRGVEAFEGYIQEFRRAG